MAEAEDSSANSLISSRESPTTPAQSFAFRRIRSIALFVQLDANGIEMLAAIHVHLANAARDTAASATIMIVG
jgi:hypothetical protein